MVCRIVCHESVSTTATNHRLNVLWIRCWPNHRGVPLGLNFEFSEDCGTHSLYHSKLTVIFPQTKNLRVVELRLGRNERERAVRYLGIEADDAPDLAEVAEL